MIDNSSKDSTWFISQVLSWYQQYGRAHLPWKTPDNPYFIWVSEIMLQQTQVATVIPYFDRFIQRFPDINTLANSPLDEVLSLWAGLGYYARARNLYQAAQIMATQYAGKVPDEFHALIALPGIGRSTAGAILAQAFQKAFPILDGNVKRVLTRFWGIDSPINQPETENRLWALSESLTPHQSVDAYTQAMMDIGATRCKRRKPDCEHCPLKQKCYAFKHQCQETLPYKIPKKKKKPLRRICFVILSDGEKVKLIKRDSQKLWGGLWCLPQALSKANIKEHFAKRYQVVLKSITPLPVRKHSFTHFDLQFQPFLVQVNPMPDTSCGWFLLTEALECALPAPIYKLLRDYYHGKNRFLSEA